MRKRYIALFVAALATIPSTSRAALLSDLLKPGGFIVSGDKKFSDFTYSTTGEMPVPAAVNVNAVTLGGNYGIQIQGGFLDLPGGINSDAHLTYTVTVLDLHSRIYDAELQGNPDVIAGGGKMSVAETFTPEYANAMTVFDNASPHAFQNVDHTLFTSGGCQPDKAHFLNCPKVIHAQTDILGASRGGIPVLSFINETYSQIQVPEPATLALLGVGALAFARRRKKA